MTRGREANHLYLARESVTDRAEFGPSGLTSRDPVRRLVASLERSEAQVMALEQLEPGNRVLERIRARRRAGPGDGHGFGL